MAKLKHSNVICFQMFGKYYLDWKFVGVYLHGFLNLPPFPHLVAYSGA